MANYYAVKVGRKPGIYPTWAECEAQVKGFPGAKFKKFTSKNEAEDFIEGQSAPIQKSISKNISNVHIKDGLACFVDGSFNKFNATYGSGWVAVLNHQVIKTHKFSGNNPKYNKSYQIAGEVFAALSAIKWAKEEGYKQVGIYYDYMGIEEWAVGNWQARSQIAIDYVNYYKEIKDGIDIEFIKVKAHSGIDYNEMADLLAKSATR